MTDLENTTVINWVKASERLPEVSNLVSEPLLFVASNEIAAGHYHMNGWFYADGERYNLQMARGINKCDSDVFFSGRTGKELPKVSHWCYTKDIAIPAM